MRKIFLLFLIASTFVGYSQLDTAFLWGKVIDAETGEPIKKVSLFVNKNTQPITLTDKDGNFWIEKSFSGDLTLTHRDYVTLHYFPEEKTRPVTIVLNRAKAKDGLGFQITSLRFLDFEIDTTHTYALKKGQLFLFNKNFMLVDARTISKHYGAIRRIFPNRVFLISQDSAQEISEREDQIKLLKRYDIIDFKTRIEPLLYAKNGQIVCQTILADPRFDPIIIPTSFKPTAILDARYQTSFITIYQKKEDSVDRIVQEGPILHPDSVVKMAAPLYPKDSLGNLKIGLQFKSVDIPFFAYQDSLFLYAENKVFSFDPFMRLGSVRKTAFDKNYHFIQDIRQESIYALSENNGVWKIQRLYNHQIKEAPFFIGVFPDKITIRDQRIIFLSAEGFIRTKMYLIE